MQNESKWCKCSSNAVLCILCGSKQFQMILSWLQALLRWADVSLQALKVPDCKARSLLHSKPCDMMEYWWGYKGILLGYKWYNMCIYIYTYTVIYILYYIIYIHSFQLMRLVGKASFHQFANHIDSPWTDWAFNSASRRRAHCSNAVKRSLGKTLLHKYFGLKHAEWQIISRPSRCLWQRWNAECKNLRRRSVNYRKEPQPSLFSLPASMLCYTK